ncbi:hypothetical protein F0Q45_05370 [Mycobacterium simiae]|uniref:Transmembrane protein n=1 Tax=Mycobacterium simiae TaxID=1784 RepID=A0A5B1BV85_MYCSI|nr:hypothetical protein [Mycobacterium simiae]KAA1251243.1 hypothetical protein F0Q45_05370 [Mycobacterium simiae]
MTGSDSETEETRQISVAELLARNGTIGAPSVTRRRHRRRGDSDSVTVAELTGEIPIVRDVRPDERRKNAEPATLAAPSELPTPPEPSNRRIPVADTEPAADRFTGPASEQPDKARYWSEPEPRWPKSEPIARRKSGPERSEYPRPLRHTDGSDTGGQLPGAEDMSPDPVDHYGGTGDTSVDALDALDALDAEVGEADAAAGDSAYVRSYLQAAEGTLFGGHSLADEVARRGDPAPAVFDQDQRDTDVAAAAREPRRVAGLLAALWRGTVVALQSILAVVFGAGLFIAFDQLWRWNSIVALVLSVLVILGLVVAVRVVRKTEDIASTLIAVAVGALITWGPLVLSLQTG